MVGRPLVPLCLFLLVALATARMVRIHTSHPISNAITMIKGLEKTVAEEAAAEELLYEKFDHWCTRSKKALTEAIDEGTSKLESLELSIDGTEKELEVIGKEIQSLQNEQSDLNQADTDAQNARTNQAALHNSTKTALEDTLEAVQHALTAMTNARSTLDPILVQQRLNTISELAFSAVSERERSLLQTWNSTGGNATNATPTTRPPLLARDMFNNHTDEYEFKSHSVIGILESLRAKFKADLVKCDAEFANYESAFALSSAARQDLLNQIGTSISQKTGRQTTLTTNLGNFNSERTTTKNDLTADKNTLKTTKSDCGVKASEWAERTKIRSQETEALRAAVEVLEQATGVRTGKPTMTSLPPPVFLQLNNPETQKALKLLREEARVSRSQAIAQIAQAVALRPEGPFDQVINSIQKMIFRLFREQKEEDDHKNWCDKELSKTNAGITDLESKRSDLEGDINTANAKIGTLGTEITAAQTRAAAITTRMTEAIEIRQKNKEENMKAIKDAEEAQTALAQAVAVIKDFYAKTGRVTLVQAPVTLPSSPSTWTQPYTGVVGQSQQPQGMIAVLEASSQSFSQMESQTIAQEDTDLRLFEDDMKTNKVDRAKQMETVRVKSQTKKNLESQVASWQATMKTVIREKDATTQYLADLQPACTGGNSTLYNSTYDVRKQARADEIDALQQAQDHLETAFENLTNTTQGPSPWIT